MISCSCKGLIFVITLFNGIVDITRDYHPGVCFLEGTRISINDTEYKEVQYITELDNVLSYDTNSKEFVTSKVLSNFNIESNDLDREG